MRHLLTVFLLLLLTLSLCGCRKNPQPPHGLGAEELEAWGDSVDSAITRRDSIRRVADSIAEAERLKKMDEEAERSERSARAKAAGSASYGASSSGSSSDGGSYREGYNDGYRAGYRDGLDGNVYVPTNSGGRYGEGYISGYRDGFDQGNAELRANSDI